MPSLVLHPPHSRPATRVGPGTVGGGAVHSASSSLEDSETSAQARIWWGLTHRHWHRGFETAREAVWNALYLGETEADAKRCNRLAGCCRHTDVRCGADSSIGVVPMRCRDRACPSCALQRSRQVGDRAVLAVKTLDAPRFATLTMPSVDATLSEQLRAMRAAFGRLRRSKLWRRCVVGGLYTVQITFSTARGQWHPHLHCIIDGEFIPQRELREAWRAALNATAGPWRLGPDDPLVVDIRAVPSRTAAAKYVARYVASPNEIERWPPDRIREYAKATHGQRMLTMFGTLHKLETPETEPTETVPAREYVTDMQSIERDANNGDNLTIRACIVLGLASPIFRRACRWAKPPDDLRPVVPNARTIAWAVGILRTRYLTPFDPVGSARHIRAEQERRRRSERRRHLWSEAQKIAL